MTPEIRQILSQQLAVILQGNLDQRITVALANGMLWQFEQSMAAMTPKQENPNAQ